MKIEAAIVARPRFRRVPGKLNCTAEYCPGERDGAGVARARARGVRQRGIPCGKQVGRTNFQFNRTSEWPTDLFSHLFLSSGWLRRYCQRIARAGELSSLLEALHFCDAEDYGTARASCWNKNTAGLFAWFPFGLNGNFVSIITRNARELGAALALGALRDLLAFRALSLLPILLSPRSVRGRISYFMLNWILNMEICSPRDRAENYNCA